MPRVHDDWTVLPHEPIEAIDDGPAIEPDEMPALGLPDAEQPHVWCWWRPLTWRDLAAIEKEDARHLASGA